MLRARHQLPVLHPAELGERAIRRLVAPDALRRREHRVAAIAFLVVAVVLVAMNDDLVADLPSLDLGADRPDDAGRVGAGDMIGVLVHVQGRDRLAKRRPHAIVVDARGHHQNQHVMAVERPGRHDLDLHGLLRRPMPVLAHDPRVHRRRNVTERRNLADLVEILDLRRCERLGAPRGECSWLPHGSFRRGWAGIGFVVAPHNHHCAEKPENQPDFRQPALRCSDRNLRGGRKSGVNKTDRPRLLTGRSGTGTCGDVDTGRCGNWRRISRDLTSRRSCSARSSPSSPSAS